MQLDLEFYVKAYLPSLVNQKNIAYQVVQSTTHCAFILVGAVLAVVFNNPRFPNFWSLVVVGFLVLFVLHIRSCLINARPGAQAESKRASGAEAPRFTDVFGTAKAVPFRRQAPK